MFTGQNWPGHSHCLSSPSLQSRYDLSLEKMPKVSVDGVVQIGEKLTLPLIFKKDSFAHKLLVHLESVVDRYGKDSGVTVSLASKHNTLDVKKTKFENVEELLQTMCSVSYSNEHKLFLAYQHVAGLLEPLVRMVCASFHCSNGRIKNSRLRRAAVHLLTGILVCVGKTLEVADVDTLHRYVIFFADIVLYAPASMDDFTKYIATDKYAKHLDKTHAEHMEYKKGSKHHSEFLKKISHIFHSDVAPEAKKIARKIKKGVKTAEVDIKKGTSVLSTFFNEVHEGFNLAFEDASKKHKRPRHRPHIHMGAHCDLDDSDSDEQPVPPPATPPLIFSSGQR